MTDAPQRDWWQRNLKWVILAAVLTFLLLFAAFIAGIFYVVVSATRSSDVYRTALTRAQSDARVRDLLGEPVEPGWLVNGRIEVTGREGEADIGIPIHGPRGKAEISVLARKRAGTWRFELIEVRGGDAAPIDLRRPDEDGTRP